MLSDRPNLLLSDSFFGRLISEDDVPPFADQYIRNGQHPVMPGRLMFLDLVHLAPPSTTGDQVFIVANNGANAAASNVAPLAGRPGLIRHTTGTTAAGRSQTQTNMIGTGNWLVDAGLNVRLSYGGVRVPTLSDAVEEFGCSLGHSDQGGALRPANNGLQLIYDRAVDGVNWRRVFESGGAITNEDSGVVATAGAFLDVRFEIQGVTESRLYINNVLNRTFPAFGAVALGAMIGIFKTVGLTARNFDYDYFEIDIRDAS